MIQVNFAQYSVFQPHVTDIKTVISQKMSPVQQFAIKSTMHSFKPCRPPYIHQPEYLSLGKILVTVLVTFNQKYSNFKFFPVRKMPCRDDKSKHLF